MSWFEQGFLIVQQALHYAEGTVSSVAVGLPELESVPSGDRRIRRVLIHNRGDVVRWIADPAQDPTATYGDVLDADDILVYDGPLDDISFILDNTAVGDSTLHVHYFGA